MSSFMLNFNAPSLAVLFDPPFPFNIPASNLLLQKDIPFIETVVKRTWLIHLLEIQIHPSEINLMIRKICICFGIGPFR